MRYPKIYLAIDNCFASKRYTDPSDWARVIRELGLTYVEASADNECDPLYSGPEYIAWWTGEVKKATEKHGVVVANLYSGHGTYATLGLAHTHPIIRDRFLNNWLKPMARTAGALGAGLGFFCLAFTDAVLQDPALYREAEKTLYENLAELAAFGKKDNLGVLGLEQMYTPHQIPWTVAGAERLMREIYRIGGAPFYLTVDVGHMNGQRKFVRPSDEALVALHERFRAGEALPEIREAFGDGVFDLDGALNRKELARVAFEDPANRRKLEAILHPRVQREMLRRIDLAAEEGVKVVFLNVPLLFETGVDALCDETWVLLANPETQVARVMMRDRVEREDVEIRIVNQMPNEEKAERATVVVSTDRPIEKTQAELASLYQQVLKKL